STRDPRTALFPVETGTPPDSNIPLAKNLDRPPERPPGRITDERRQRFRVRSRRPAEAALRQRRRVPFRSVAGAPRLRSQPLRPWPEPLQPRSQPLRPRLEPLRPWSEPLRTRLEPLRPRLGPLRIRSEPSRPRVEPPRPGSRCLLGELETPLPESGPSLARSPRWLSRGRSLLILDT